MDWNIGTRVQTPAVRGEVRITATACVPFFWSGMALVALEGLPGLWECRVLVPASPETAGAEAL